MKGIRHLLGHSVRTVIARVRTPQTPTPTPTPTPLFTAAMTIDEAWHAHRGAPAVFGLHHLPACDGCSVRFDERVSEAAAAYGIDLDTFLTDLNALRL